MALHQGGDDYLLDKEKGNRHALQLDWQQSSSLKTEYTQFRNPNRNKFMKMKRLFLALIVLLSLINARAQAATISQTIASINADSKKEGGPARVLASISASTHVPVATLEKQMAKTHLGFGDLYAAHAIASAAKKSFDEIAGLKTRGQSWEKIAEANNVSLDGKKTAAKKDVPAKPQATAAPVKTLRQLQNERYSGQSSGN